VTGAKSIHISPTYQMRFEKSLKIWDIIPLYPRLFHKNIKNGSNCHPLAIMQIQLLENLIGPVAKDCPQMKTVG